MDAYEVFDEIGSGSFGKVYFGRKKGSYERVALKKISKQGRCEREIKSLRQECEIQKNLHHPNIIQMLDSFETEDSVVVVTEFAQCDLCKLLCAQGPLSVPNVQMIACHLVSALYFLHSHRTLHRDIKPQNILIGIDKKAKLCDFGFARTMGINTYMLTSIKGTPLYMAPEIVQEKPYDHNADLWSLGCILYELLVGTPPFYTTSILHLVRMIKNEPIAWPQHIAGECLSFLQGLLEKDPKKRLTWPALLTHPFVQDGVYIDNTVAEFALTKALSPSQELAKEKERELLQRELAGYSRIIMKTSRKLEEAKKKLKRCSEDGRMEIKTPLPSPNGLPMNRQGMGGPSKKPSQACDGIIGVPPQDPLKISPNLPSDNAEPNNLKVMFNNLRINDGIPAKRGNQADAKQPLDIRFKFDDDPGRNSASSCETMTSSSEFETGSDDSDGADADTVIMENQRKRETKKKYSSSTRQNHGSKSNDDQPVNRFGLLDANIPEKSTSRGGSGMQWKSGALFTLHSFGSEDKPINSDEWINFIMNTMKEVWDNPKCLCEKHFLTMLVAPLRNHLADPDVVEKIAILLSVPYTLDKSIHDTEPGLMTELQGYYLDTKVLPNLLYSCKLIVRRRRIERGGSVTLDEITSILTSDDLNALDKCLRLATFLVHEDDSFVTQLCDSVCVLQAFAILQLFLKLDSVRKGLAANTVALLCHILRVFPANKSIVEEILLDEIDSNAPDAHGELWRLMTHPNPLIQSRSLRLFTYLCLNSDRVKTEVLDRHRSRVWKILRKATNSNHTEIRETAEFVLQTINKKTFASIKSNSSGCQSQATQPAPMSSIPCESQEKKINESLKSSEFPVVEESLQGNASSSGNSGLPDDPSR